MHDQVGALIAERYELQEVVGRGGQGIVYRAWDRAQQRQVAVKMLSTAFARDPESAARLLREQEALVALAGTSAVAVYDFCRGPDGGLCLVMELLEGREFEEYLIELESRGEHLSMSRLNAIIEPVVETLERAHDAGILHRDLKPGNIFLLADGEGVRLFDFGLSRMKTATRLTMVGTVMGSPSYIAPEVWKGNSDELDCRCDVYSLGVIIFRALSGHLPFSHGSLRDQLIAVTNSARPSLHTLRPDLPAALDDWVNRALAIDREERYPDVRSLWNGLLGALHYAPPPRPSRPVADSIVSAWKAATGAFRRFLESKPPGATATPLPVGRHSPIPAAARAEPGTRSGTQAKPRTQPPPRRHSQPAPAGPPSTDEWTELTDDDLDRPSVVVPVEETAAKAVEPAEPVKKDDEWAEVTDAEVDRPSLYLDAEERPKSVPEAPADSRKRGGPKSNEGKPASSKSKKKHPKAGGKKKGKGSKRSGARKG